MSRNRTRRAAFAASASIILAAASASPVGADVFTWSGLGANNLWNNGLNWQGGIAPPSAATTAIVMNGTAQTTNVLNLGGFGLNSLTFTSNAGAFTINQSGAGDFFNFFNTGLASPHIDQFSSANQAINFPTTGFILNSDLLLGGTGSGSLTLTGQSQGAGRYVLNGPYTVIANPSAGWIHAGMTINAGTLRIGADNVLGSGAVNFGGGTLQFSNSFNIGHQIVVNAGGGTIDANGFAAVVNAPVTVNGSGRLSVTNSAATATTTTIAANLQQSGGLLVSGSGGANTVSLTGTNTYANGTTIAGGATLIVDGDARLGNAAGGITLDGGGTLRYAALSSNPTRPVTLTNGGGTIDLSAGVSIGINAAISGSGGITKTGNGALGYFLANSYSGTTNITAGSISLIHTQAAQNTTINLSGTGQLFFNTGTITLGGLSGGNGISIGGMTSLSIGGNNASTSFAGNITGAAAGGGVVFKMGTGTWTLSGTNTFTSQFTVQSGTVVAASAGAISPNASMNIATGATVDLNGFNMTVNHPNGLVVNTGAALRLNGGNLTIPFGRFATFFGSMPMEFGTLNASASSTITYNGATLSNGFLAGPGTQTVTTASTTFNNVTLANGTAINVNSTLNLNNCTAGGALLVNGGTLNFNNGSLDSSGNITLSGALNTFGFANNGGSVTVNNSATWSHGTGPLVSGGGSIVTVNAGGTIQLNGNNFDLHGALLANNGSVTGGTLNIYYGSLAAGTGTFPATVVIHPGGTYTPGVSLSNIPPFTPVGIGVIQPLDPDQTAATPITLNANTTATVSASDNSLTLSANMSGAGKTLTKQGGGTLALGRLRVGGLSVNDGVVQILPNGTAAASSTVSSISTSASGRFDLTDNKLIVLGAGNAGTFGGGAYSGLTGQIAAAYDFGAWDGASGIATSESDAIAGITTIAIATADETGYAGGVFSGVSVNSGDVLLMYTYAGDANLDGTIDGGDYGIIDNFVQVPGAFGYANGDFNFDGVIDGGDYGIIDNNIQAQGAPFPTSALGALSGISAVPEPSACGLAMLGAIGLFRGRRRCRR